MVSLLLVKSMCFVFVCFFVGDFCVFFRTLNHIKIKIILSQSILPFELFTITFIWKKVTLLWGLVGWLIEGGWRFNVECSLSSGSAGSAMICAHCPPGTLAVQ